MKVDKVYNLSGAPMKRFGIALMASVGMISLAHAADLPTKKAVEAAPAKPNCWASVWDWLNTSAADCPLSYAGFTFYGTVDVGYGYQDWGVQRSPTADKVNYGIQKNGYEHVWTATYAGLSSNVLGVKMKQDLAPLGLTGWSLIGTMEAGFNPYSGMFLDPPQSLATNNVNAANGVITINGKKYYGFYQTANFDSSRNGTWWNSQAFVGLSNKTYGSLTFGRTNTLATDLVSAYDPFGAATAFSLLGFSNSFAGFGDTETIRPNTAFTYKGTYQNFRGAAQIQVGGYGVGNGSTAQYQGSLGGDFGPFSVDGVVSWAENAVSLSGFNGGNLAEVPKTNQWFIKVNNAYYDPNSVLKATLSNNFGLGIGLKYKWNQLTFSGGYLYADLMNPSDDYLTGFKTISSGIFVPPGYFSKTKNGYVYVNDAITVNQYNNHKKNNTFWGGVKWSARSDLDFITGILYQSQNNFNTTYCTGYGINISSSKCSGGQSGASFMVDWRPVKRMDVYAGVMVTNVYGGLANGFLHSQNYDPTAGIRFKF